MTRLLLILLVATVNAACSAGSGEGLNISGRPIEEGGELPLAATLASIQANLFDPACILCHAGANAPLGLRLDAANSFTNLVGVRSVGNASVFRVDPGDPDRSNLIHKLEGSAATGAQMPLGGPPIPQATIDFVRQWITDGAPDTNDGQTASALRILSLQPAPASVIAALPPQIVIAFDQALDASTVHDQTFELWRSGGDNVFGNGNDARLALSSVEASLLNSQLVMLELSGPKLADDLYRVVVRGSGPSVVVGLAGAALDGDFVSEFRLLSEQP